MPDVDVCVWKGLAGVDVENSNVENERLTVLVLSDVVAYLFARDPVRAFSDSWCEYAGGVLDSSGSVNADQPLALIHTCRTYQRHRICRAALRRHRACASLRSASRHGWRSGHLMQRALALQQLLGPGRGGLGVLRCIRRLVLLLKSLTSDNRESQKICIAIILNSPMAATDASVRVKNFILAIVDD